MFLNDLNLNEAYFPKPASIIKIERAFEKIVDKINKDKFWTPIGNPEIIELESAITKAFNFEDIVIQWNPSLARAAVNAATAPVVYIVGNDPKAYAIKKTAQGYKFKNNKGIYGLFFFTQGLIHHVKLTPAELTAILLHEVGHNFFVSPLYRLQTYFYFLILIAIGIFMILGASNPEEKKQAIYHMINLMLGFILIAGVFGKGNRSAIKQTRDNLIATLLKTEASIFIRKIEAIISDALVIIALIINAALVPMYLLPSLIITLFFSPLNFFLNFYLRKGYLNEKFADKFATTYGYGPELASGLDKLNQYASKDISAALSLPIVGSAYELTMLLGVMDPHPTTEMRVRNVIKELKAELAGGKYPKGMKNAILKDVKQTEDILNLMNKRDVSIDHSLGYRIRNYIQRKIREAITGSPTRDVFDYIYPTSGEEILNIEEGFRFLDLFMEGASPYYFL